MPTHRKNIATAFGAFKGRVSPLRDRPRAHSSATDNINTTVRRAGYGRLNADGGPAKRRRQLVSDAIPGSETSKGLSETIAVTSTAIRRPDRQRVFDSDQRHHP